MAAYLKFFLQSVDQLFQWACEQIRNENSIYFRLQVPFFYPLFLKAIILFIWLLSFKLRNPPNIGQRFSSKI